MLAFALNHISMADLWAGAGDTLYLVFLARPRQSSPIYRVTGVLPTPLFLPCDPGFLVTAD